MPFHLAFVEPLASIAKQDTRPPFGSPLETTTKKVPVEGVDPRPPTPVKLHDHALVWNKHH